MEPASMSGGVSSVTSRISMVVAGCSLEGGGAIDVSPLKVAASQKESSLLHKEQKDADQKYCTTNTLMCNCWQLTR
jgi:hypothetical protein